MNLQIKRGLLFGLLLSCLLLTGCQGAAAARGPAAPEQSAAEDPAQEATASPEEPESKLPTTQPRKANAQRQGSFFEAERLPEAYQNTEYLDLAPSQIINEIPASYARFGMDADRQAALEEEWASDKTFPILSISTKEAEEILSREIYVSCVVDVFNCPEQMQIREASAGIRVRGNASAYYGDVEQMRANPVPYRIKFDKKTNLLGLNQGGACKSWVLLKVLEDLVKDDLCLRLGRAIVEEPVYCTDTQMVYVYVNGVCKGLYLLCGQNQVNKHRVNISEPESGYPGTDIGYYVELDQYGLQEDKPAFLVDYGGYTVTDLEGDTYSFVPSPYSIKSDVYTQGQVDFISNYIQGVFTIVYEACEQGNYLTFDENYHLVQSDYGSAQEAIGAVMDLPSVVNMYLLYELVHDYDCGEGSFFMCVDFDQSVAEPRLQFTSPWDFSWTLSGDTERYWAAAFGEEKFIREEGDRANPWFVVLAKQDWFRTLAAERWAALRANDAISRCLEEETRLLEEHAADFNGVFPDATEKAQKPMNWLRNRIDWMNRAFVPDEVG